MTLDLILNGLSKGASVAILAVAFYLVYCIARTFHVALAGIYALTPFVFWQLQQARLVLAISLVLSIFMGAAISILCEVGNHSPLRRLGALPEAHLLSSLGIYVVMVQLALMIWGPEVRLLRTGLEPMYFFLGVGLRQSQWVKFSAAAILLTPLICSLRWTRWGIALRALRDSPTELALLGINEGLIRALLFGIAGGLASTSALCSSLDEGFQAYYGFPNLLLAVVAALSIRRESIGAAVIAGLSLGVLRTLCIWFLGARWQDTLAYVLFALALVFRGREGSRSRKAPAEMS